MADSFSSVPGELIPGDASPGDPGTLAQQAAPVPPPGAAQRPVVIAFRN